MKPCPTSTTTRTNTALKIKDHDQPLTNRAKRKSEAETGVERHLLSSRALHDDRVDGRDVKTFA